MAADLDLPGIRARDAADLRVQDSYGRAMQDRRALLQVVDTLTAEVAALREARNHLRAELEAVNYDPGDEGSWFPRHYAEAVMAKSTLTAERDAANAIAADLRAECAEKFIEIGRLREQIAALLERHAVCSTTARRGEP